MKDYRVPIQSLIDHINTATDVDPWAKEMAADLLGCLYEKEQRTKVEFIESYIKIGNGEYQWNDNHGELIRCKDCKHYCPGFLIECAKDHHTKQGPDWYCADGERRKETDYDR